MHACMGIRYIGCHTGQHAVCHAASEVPRRYLYRLAQVRRLNLAKILGQADNVVVLLYHLQLQRQAETAAVCTYLQLLSTWP